MTATATKRKGTAPRKAASRAKANGNGNGSSLSVPSEEFVPSPPEEFVPTTAPAGTAVVAGEVAGHPYGEGRRVFTYQPRDGSDPIVFPHISTCRPDALFLYDNRKKDEMRLCFAWMDRAGVPDQIGRRVWMLPEDEQGAVVTGWFSGLELAQPQGVAPPGES